MPCTHCRQDDNMVDKCGLNVSLSVFCLRLPNSIDIRDDGTLQDIISDWTYKALTYINAFKSLY